MTDGDTRAGEVVGERLLLCRGAGDGSVGELRTGGLDPQANRHRDFAARLERAESAGDREHCSQPRLAMAGACLYSHEGRVAEGLGGEDDMRGGVGAEVIDRDSVSDHVALGHDRR